MFALPLVASFFATLSLPVVSLTIAGRQTPLCPWNGVPNANNFTLLAVFKTDDNVEKPLALGSTIEPGFGSLAWIGVFSPPSLRDDHADASLYHTER
jgi:hypothetical protein